MRLPVCRSISVNSSSSVSLPCNVSCEASVVCCACACSQLAADARHALLSLRRQAAVAGRQQGQDFRAQLKQGLLGGVTHLAIRVVQLADELIDLLLDGGRQGSRIRLPRQAQGQQDSHCGHDEWFPCRGRDSSHDMTICLKRKWATDQTD